jgi:hypothetical protein
MNPAPDLAGYDASRDPDFATADVGSKKSGPGASDSQRRRRQFRMRTLMLAVALAAVWMGVLLDPSIGPLVLGILAAFGFTLALMGAAMGLGLLGLGLCSAGDRVVGWLRRASRWPDE